MDPFRQTTAICRIRYRESLGYYHLAVTADGVERTEDQGITSYSGDVSFLLHSEAAERIIDAMWNSRLKHCDHTVSKRQGTHSAGMSVHFCDGTIGDSRITINNYETINFQVPTAWSSYDLFDRQFASATACDQQRLASELGEIIELMINIYSRSNLDLEEVSVAND